MRQRALFAIALLIVVAVVTMGCARRLVGRAIDEDNIPKIAVGKTTREEIFALFGSPYRMEAKDDQDILTYLHGRDFVWTAGLYTESKSQADILTVFIDKRGVVSNYAFTKGASTPELLRPIVPQAR